VKGGTIAAPRRRRGSPTVANPTPLGTAAPATALATHARTRKVPDPRRPFAPARTVLRLLHRRRHPLRARLRLCARDCLPGDNPCPAVRPRPPSPPSFPLLLPTFYCVCPLPLRAPSQGSADWGDVAHQSPVLDQGYKVKT